MPFSEPDPSPPSVAGGRVTVLQSSSLSPRARRCLTRLREELAAGGFEVTVSEFGAGGEALWMVDPASHHDGSTAAITLVGNPDEGDAELWVVDGVPPGRVRGRDAELRTILEAAPPDAT